MWILSYSWRFSWIEKVQRPIPILVGREFLKTISRVRGFCRPAAQFFNHCHKDESVN